MLMIHFFGNVQYYSNSTSNNRPFGCPIIYTDTIHNAILFIDLNIP